ncbi:endoribonuclease Dcr-1-like isoform X1 [Vanessa cardui]|uniref:endoribonuclease Dcr-1-like isoform X1 n=1 Tax=Vanessa cardui TaxID=171605 RepID=UPI001F13A238|nr:endoribonuclease Dcr-1-like isoform X1 [Vanessa cardui]XP_046976249.1 endoribonuclease Dcr-1-like isoform X1 [Vanessa cardui]XP_046976250.1 endoribonuclease Dcr-1-like isoform X1 [Vanessa cardui]XP_046976251.1 endoribonuclease Dcr-1-like isoform X1 [Vanessa cardui]XP_046976252.1 endoribonuclease Dcr-1-like isoform X1 [Vanessa cardui]XP_046976253.1 endoribonuclease Dcr-1-like isoform X1 [Vanessa cardui]
MDSSCTRFTAAEGGARLAACAGTKNILVTEHTSFISTSVLMEHAFKIRGLLSKGCKRSVYVTRASRIECTAHELAILTDLSVTKARVYDDVDDWKDTLEHKEVLVCTSIVIRTILENGLLTVADINVLIIDSCHLIFKDQNLQYVMKLYKECDEEIRPRILALTYPLFTAPNTGDSTDPVNIDKTEIDKDIDDKDKDVESDDDIEIANDNVDDFDMYEKLEWKICELESALCCEMDLAEDIDGGKRLSATATRPRELIIEYGPRDSMEALPEAYLELEDYMKETVNHALQFINEHRYDPTEIYGEDMYEEFKNIPDPTIEPKNIFTDFLYVLEQLGPYAADKAAISLLTKLEKLKIKVPYERHFLLLCLCTSVFVKIRCFADLMFSKCASDWEKITMFSTPKVLRLVEILEKFQPLDNQNNTKTNDSSKSNSNRCIEENVKLKEETSDGSDTESKLQADNKTDENDSKRDGNVPKNESCDVKRSKTSELLNEIDKCDFVTLGNRIEDRVNTYEANLKDYDYTEDVSFDKVANSDKQSVKCDDVANSEKQSVKCDDRNAVDGKVFGKRFGHRSRGRGRALRSNAAKLLQMQQNPDALCGIVFMKEALMAKIMFMMIADMSRSRPSLSHLCAQYCADEGPNGSKKQEDVLKKFRMHECNLLLATSVLEEGIDLPRCNLVVRWDVPPSYRSHGLCRGRARASRSAVALLAARSDCAPLAHNLAVYKELDQLITRKCGCGIQNEPSVEEENHADTISPIIKAYTPLELKRDGNNDTNKPIDRIDRKENNIESETANTGDLSVNCKMKDAKDNNDCEANDHYNDNNETLDVNDGAVNGDLDNDASDDISKADRDVKLEKSHKTLDFREDSCDVNDTSFKCNVKYDYKVTSDRKSEEQAAFVDLNTAIALINRYCGKLPSDTFTRLTPQWWMEEVQLPDRRGDVRTAYICTLRMPLNCPIKYNIVGHPMPTRVLARRMVALQACRILHKSGELDDQLMPIGKENFKSAEFDNTVVTDTSEASDCARPGTTKRRQYYYKRTAWAFTDCQAIIDCTDSDIENNPTLDSDTTQNMEKDGPRANMLYCIVSSLCCALPERYNTRGRRLHAPQLARQAIGVLMARRDPHLLQIPAFPVYTRSGEVRVSVEAARDADVRLSPRRARLIRRFMRFVFSDVLRVRRRGMKLQPEGSTHNNYYVVPTVKKTRSDGTTWVDIDWPFLELIYKHTEEKKNSELEKPMIWEEGEKKKTKEDRVKNLENPLLKPGEVFVFDAEKYKEAVVTPWYRNQDQPQFFLVAEICWKLTPDSAFPSDQHTSFRSYYKAKYGADLTQSCQPLLDVDHTSARLNLLTPRYVNRKGVALPVSSERTRRAKRDRLDQKQILVPELCRVHPFAAPLWFATVALPCVLYRINALLIADEIRRSVAIDVGLGIPRIDERTCPGFQWPPLDFGWSLAEVLSADSEKGDKKKDDEEAKIDDEDKESKIIEDTEREKETEDRVEGKEGVKEKTINDILQEKEDAESGFEIGTWSNDMASSIPQRSEFDEFMEPLPPNLTFCTSSSGGANWSDPIEKPKISHYNPGRTFSMADSDCSYLSSDFDTDDSDLTDASDEDTDTSGFCSSRNSNALLSAAMGVRIEYKTAHEAEAVDLERRRPLAPAPPPDARDDRRDLARARRALRAGAAPAHYVKKFRESVAKHEQEIKDNGLLIDKDQKIEELLPETSRDIDKTTPLAHKDKPTSINVDNENKSIKDKIDDLDSENVNSNKIDNIDEIIEIVNDINLNETNENIDKDTEENSKDILNEHNEIDDAMILNTVTKKSTKDIDGVTKQINSNLNITNDIINDRDVNTNDTEIENGIATDKNKIETIATHADEMTNVETNSLNKEIDNITDNVIKGGKDKSEILDDIFPYGDGIELDNGQITLESIERNKRVLLANLKSRLSKEEIKKLNCFSMKDINIDSPDYVNEKVANVGFDAKEKYERIVNTWADENDYKPYYMDGKGQNGKEFDFDYQPNLEGHPGPSPSVILQALTMSNANDGINLERLETIGDSFLKFAITAYLYCAHPAVHEGKLSHMRSKQVSNLNLYRLGRNKRLGARMIASKFEPHDNWLPPCHKPPPTLQPTVTGESKASHTEAPVDSAGCFIPYNLITQHSIPDKSIADCVEALIGAYLLECGPRGALLFMSWLGIRVLPRHDLPLADDHPYVVRAREKEVDEKSSPKRRSSCSSWSDDEDGPESRSPEPEWGWAGRPVGALRPYRTADNKWLQPIFGELKAPPSPLLRYIEDPEGELEQMLSGYDALERTLQYRFRDRSLLLQALTHASHQRNRLTDCYQRLEFLGDAILDYLITRHLFEDPRRHSPGALTDLRSALVNNTIFATLAARHGFHKYARHHI